MDPFDINELLNQLAEQMPEQAKAIGKLRQCENELTLFLQFPDASIVSYLATRCPRFAEIFEHHQDLLLLLAEKSALLSAQQQNPELTEALAVAGQMIVNTEAAWGPIFTCAECEGKDGTIDPELLKKQGLREQAAQQFSTAYHATKLYLDAHPELSAGVACLRQLMAPLNQPKERDNVAVIISGEAQCLGLYLLGHLIYGTGFSVDQWHDEVNYNPITRGIISALLPSWSLPPRAIHHGAMIELPADFAHQYYQEKQDPLELDTALDDLARFFTYWQHCNETARRPLTQYQPLHGFVSGFECTVTKPRFTTIIPEHSTLNPDSTIDTILLYNGTSQQTMLLNALHYYLFHEIYEASSDPHHLPTRKLMTEVNALPEPSLTEQWGKYLVPALKDCLEQPSPLLFFMCKPEHLPNTLVAPIAQTGSSFLMDIEQYAPASIHDYLERVFKSKRREAQTQVFTSNPYYYQHCLCQTTVLAVRLEYVAKALSQLINTHCPKVRSLIKFERKDFICQAQPQIFNSQARTIYFVTNINCEAPDSFDKILCALSEFERHEELYELLLTQDERDNTSYSLNKAFDNMAIDHLCEQLATYATKRRVLKKTGLPAACPEFKELGKDAALYSSYLYKWEGLLKYLPRIIKPEA